MQRRHSPSSLRDGFAELPSSRRGTPQSETSELTFAPKKKDRKWTLGGLFRRRKNKSSDTENSSSLEENTADGNNKHKSNFLKRKLSLKKKPSGSRKVVGKFEFTKSTSSNEKQEPPLIINRDVQLSGYSYEKLSSLNSSSLSSKQRFDSLTLLQTGSSCGSLNSSGKRSSKNDVKARVEAEHEKLKDSSSDDEFAYARKYHSQDNINDSLKRRSRAARTERYLKRLNQINNLPYHQQAELLRMLDRNKVNIKHFMFQPPTHMKVQSANSSLTNSPMPNIKFTFRPSETNYSQNNLYVNVTNAEHHKLTKSYSKPSPLLPRHTLRQIDLNNSVNSVDDRHIYMNITSPNSMPSSKVPPMPPPRDPHRKVICTYSSPSCVNFQQRPVSYAFEAPKFTSVDNLANRSHPVTNFGLVNGNYRSNSEQHIGSGPVYSPTNDRPASVLQFTSDIDYSAAPTDYQYITDQKPRSRRPIQIECNGKQSSNVTSNLEPNNRLYFSDQHINSSRFENSSSPRSSVNSTEDQVWRKGGKLHQFDNSVATIPQCNRNALTDGKNQFQFNNKVNKIDHNDLDQISDHVPSANAHLSRRNSKEICQFVRPLSMVLEKSESEMESSKSDSRTRNPNIIPPDPPVRKSFCNAGKNRVGFDETDGKIATPSKNGPKEFKFESVNSVDIDELLEFNKQHNPSYNLEEALNELEEIYKSLQLSDDDLLDRAERRDIPAQLHAILSRDFNSDSSCDEVDSPARKRRERTRSLSTDRKKDDMAYRRIYKTDNPNFVPRLDPRNIMSQAGSFLLVSPTLAPPVFSNLSDPPLSPIPTNEPDVTYDDVVFRSIKHVKNSLKTLDPQPPFGIPVGPITQASSTDYLHAIPEDRYKPTFSSRKTPDIVKDDLAYRNLRKDLNHNPKEYRKKRAIRSLSANLSGVLSRAEKLKYSFPHPLSYARSSSYNDLPSECSKEQYPCLEPSLSQLYSSASTESLTDYDVSEFLRHKTPTNYEALLRKFNSKFESSLLNETSSPAADTLTADDGKVVKSEVNASEYELGQSEVKELIKAIESNKLNKTSLQKKKISQHKPIVLSTFNPTLTNENGTNNAADSLISSSLNVKSSELDSCLVANLIEGSDVCDESDISTRKSSLGAEENTHTKVPSTEVAAFDDKLVEQDETPLNAKMDPQNDSLKCPLKQEVFVQTRNHSVNEPKVSGLHLKNERSSIVSAPKGSKSFNVDVTSSNGFSSEKDLKAGDTAEFYSNPKSISSHENNERRTDMNEGSVPFLENQDILPSEDALIGTIHSKSKEISESNTESNSVKSCEFKLRRHSKIEIPKKFRETNGYDSLSKDLIPGSGPEASAKSASTVCPNSKKKRLSQIDIPERFKESKENLTSSDVVMGTVSKHSPEHDTKSKSSNSPKISQIEIPEKFRESNDNLVSSSRSTPDIDFKPNESVECDPTSKSAKSPKSKKKRLSQSGVSEKFRKSMKHLASSYAVEQETDLKVNSSSSEGDAKVKSTKSPKSKKKRLSKIEIPENSRKSKENLASTELVLPEVDSKSSNSGRDSKTKSSKSPKVRRKRSSVTDSPEKKRGHENLVICDIAAPEAAAKPSDNLDQNSKTDSTKSPKLRRKRSSQIDIPEKFPSVNENSVTTDVLPQEESSKLAEELEEKKKRPKKIEIPQIFMETVKQSVSNDHSPVESNVRSSGRSKSDTTIFKSRICHDTKGDCSSQVTSVVDLDAPCSLLNSDEKSELSNSPKNNDNEPRKVLPLKSILKKTNSNTDCDQIQNSQNGSNKTVVPSSSEKPAEDSGVILESISQSFLTFDDNDNVSGNTSLEISKILNCKNENSTGRPASSFLTPELNCVNKDDQNPIVTNTPADRQRRSECTSPEKENKQKEIEKSISGASCADFLDGILSEPPELALLRERMNISASDSNRIKEETDLVIGGKPSRGDGQDENAQTNATHIGNGRIFAATCRFETSSAVPELNDKDEIVSALNELTSKLAGTVTDRSKQPLSCLEECRETKVTTTKSISDHASPSNRKNGRSDIRNEDNHLLLQRSPKAPSPNSLAKSSNSCSDFEGIALSTSSLLAASYCFACLLQSDYLSLVNLMTGIIVIVACFVLYHVLAAD